MKKIILILSTVFILVGVVAMLGIKNGYTLVAKNQYHIEKEFYNVDRYFFRNIWQDRVIGEAFRTKITGILIKDEEGNEVLVDPKDFSFSKNGLFEFRKKDIIKSNVKSAK